MKNFISEAEWEELEQLLTKYYIPYEIEFDNKIENSILICTKNITINPFSTRFRQDLRG